MKVPFFTPVRNYHNHKEEFDNAINKILEKGNFILGDDVEKLENEIAEYTGAKYAIGVASGTDALTIASDVLGFKDDSFIITTPFTFFASASCIVRNGGFPMFVDIDEETLQIDPEKIEQEIDKMKNRENLAGILPVHLFNQMANMNEIMKIAKKYNLKVLEDGAESFGMKYKFKNSNNDFELKHSGTIGDAGIFSFFPTKTLGGYGDGGMIVTNNKKLYNLFKVYRVHGTTKKYHHEYVGYNSRLDTIQAAILRIKLKYIDNDITKRDKIGNLYNKRLQKLQDKGLIKLFKMPENQKTVYYVYNILAKNRDKLKNFLSENGIGTAIYYPVPLHLQKCFQNLGYSKGDFPVAEKISEKIIALPMFPELTDDEINYVCDKIEEFYEKK